MVDLDRAEQFMATHARIIDRRRLDVVLHRAQPGAALDALRGYRNADGGFGWGLEPDLRSPSSQPAGALHALEVCEEAGPARTPLAAEICDWLASISLPGGGLPFSVAGTASPGTAPWWGQADPTEPSLHITSAICAAAHRIAARDAAVAAHPWLRESTAFCLARIAERREQGPAMELRYVLQLLDALADDDPAAARELARVAAFVPASGELPVAGGTSDEKMRPLDFSPLPGRPLRAHLDPGVVERDLERLAAGQRADGGWAPDWVASSPAAELEWRGVVTVHALTLLHANGVLALTD